jgi:hypothetical protein
VTLLPLTCIFLTAALSAAVLGLPITCVMALLAAAITEVLGERLR